MKRLRPLRTQQPPSGAVLELGRGARAAGVAARLGFGQPERADDLATRHRDEVALLLLGCARHVERVAAQAHVGRDDDAQRTPDAADLLDRDGVRERVEPGAALLFGERDAEHAHLAELRRRSRSGSGAPSRAPR